METVSFTKAELNIDAGYEEKLIALLESNFRGYTDLKVVSTDEIAVEVEVLNENLTEFNDFRNAEINTKLRLGISIIDLAKQKNRFYEQILIPNNLLVTPNLEVMQLKRYYSSNSLSDEVVLQTVKALIAFLFCKSEYDTVYHTLDTQAKKNKHIEAIYSLETIYDIEEYLVDEISKQEIYLTEVVKKVPKNYTTKNMIIKTVLSILVVVMTFATMIMFFYILPIKQSQLEAHEKYYNENYSAVIDTLDNVSVNNMELLTKYEYAVSVVKQSDFNDLAKENILTNMSTAIDENILNYWAYIGKEDYEAAYELSTINNDAQQQAYVLIQMIEFTKIDDSLTSDEREAAITEYQGELESLGEIINPEEDFTESTDSIDEEIDDVVEGE